MIADQPLNTAATRTGDAAVQVEAELINILYRQSISSAVGTCFSVMATIGILWSHVSKVTLLSWALLFVALTAVRLALAIRHAKNPPPPEAWRKSAWIFTFFAFLAGSMWAALSLLFFNPDDMFVTTFICLILAGTTSSGVGALSVFRPAYVAVCVTALLPLAVRAMLLPNSNQFYVLGILLLLLIGISLGYSRNIHKVMRESVSTRFENLALIEQITLEKERAESANRAKSHFLAAASHDLRQPIHAMALFVGTLRALAARPELKHADIGHIATRLQDSLKNLGQLLSALLDVSRLDAGVVEAHKRPLALQATLSAVFNEFSGQARSKDLDLTVVPTSLWTDSDPIVLHRILSNLLSNAVRYTPRGRILVGCRRRADAVEIQVWDTGLGIAPDQLPKIFQEFYQVHNAARDREQGLGLGLSIVKRLTKLLDAQLDVKSTLGKGSMFSLRLPLAHCQAGAQLSVTPTAAPTLAQESKTVLAIDDDLEILDALNHLLSAWGHNVLLASNLEEALQEAEANRHDIDLLISDYRVADDLTGADVIRAVLARLGRDVPAAIITGDTSPERIREAGASGYKLLHKPLAPEELHQLIGEA
jgi:signal transduction histidine kinase/CheY-like chemotaxis protein